MSPQPDSSQLTSQSGPDRRLTVVFDGVPPEGGSLSSRSTRPDYVIDAETGCWVWQKFLLKGYGMLSLSGKGVRAYRAYYVAAHGPIPADHDVHHQCKNTRCVNPAHLEAVHERDHDIEHFLGEKAGITLDDIREIRRRGRIMGVTSKDVAKEFGISWQSVNNYWSGSRRWVDLLGDEPGPAVPKDPCLQCGGDVDRGPTGGASGKRGNRRKMFCSRPCHDAYRNARR